MGDAIEHTTGLIQALYPTEERQAEWRDAVQSLWEQTYHGPEPIDESHPAYKWLEAEGEDPKYMYSGDIALVIAGWDAALASKESSAA